MTEQRALLGIKLLSAFFAIEAVICLITIVALLFPGSALDPIWRLNPDAHAAFQKIGKLSILLMVGWCISFKMIHYRWSLSVRRAPWRQLD